MKNEIIEMKKDPAKKAEVAKLLAGRNVSYPLATKIEMTDSSSEVRKAIKVADNRLI